jgi:hypothetical protein
LNTFSESKHFLKLKQFANLIFKMVFFDSEHFSQFKYVLRQKKNQAENRNRKKSEKPDRKPGTGRQRVCGAV